MCPAEEGGGGVGKIFLGGGRGVRGGEEMLHDMTLVNAVLFCISDLNFILNRVRGLAVPARYVSHLRYLFKCLYGSFVPGGDLGSLASITW